MVHRSFFPLGNSDITVKEILLAIIFAIMGFLLTTKSWLLFLNGLSPIQGLIVYYVIMYSSLFILSQLGLIIWKFNIKSPLQVLGATMIVFAFFIVVDWESQYVQYITNADMSGASAVFYQSEDGATFYLWNTVLGISNIDVARLLTYVFTPFVLVLTGAVFVSKGIEF